MSSRAFGKIRNCGPMNTQGRVLIADDQPEIRELVLRQLSAEDYMCITVSDGEAAVQELRRNEFDIVLIDLDMPKVDGFQLLKTIQDSDWDVVPVVLTGTGNVQKAVEAMGLGAFDFLEKPYNRQLLSCTVQRAKEYHQTRCEHRANRTTADQLGSIFDAFPDMIMTVDLDGQILQCNEATARWTGADRLGLLGHDCHQAICTTAHRREDCPLIFDSGSTGSAPRLLVIKDSILEISTFELNTRPGHTRGKLVVAHDATQRRRAQEGLQASEEKYKLLFHSSRDAIITLEPPSWKFTSCNRASADVFGFGDESACAAYGPWDVSPVYQPGGRTSTELAAEIIGKAMREGSAFFEWQHLDLQGREFPASVLLTRVDRADHAFLLATVRDITAQKDAEEGLLRAKIELEQRVEERTAALAQANAGLRSEIAKRESAELESRKVNRMLRLLSECNQLIVHGKDEAEFLNQVCDVLVEFGGYPMMWIAISEPNKKADMRLVALRGFDLASFQRSQTGLCEFDGYVKVLYDTIDAGTQYISCELQTQDTVTPWSEEAIRRGCTRHIALLLSAGETCYGLLGVYTCENGPETSTEEEMLKELATDLGFAVASMRASAERSRTRAQMVKLSALKERLLDSSNLNQKLQLITDNVIDIFGADFARIWTMGEGDRCTKGCVHAAVTDGPNVCRDRSHCLHLMASSGRYTHLDGDHGRVPIGSYKIGGIASGDISAFMTNDVAHDPRVHNHEWAESLGLVSFAGWRLLSPQGKPIGVLALFSQRTISPDEGQLVEDIASTASHVIVTGIAAEELQASESKLQAILHGCPILQFVIDRRHRVISWNKPLEEYSGISESDVLGTSDHWRAFYPDKRPCLVDFLVDSDTASIERWYGGKCKPSSLGIETYEVTDFVTQLSGEGRWLHLTAAVIRDVHGAIIGAVETIEDITELRRKEVELRESRDELEVRVQERTNELAQSNASLQLEVERRTRVEGVIRQASKETERLMASMSSFLIALDMEQNVTRWNAASESVFGVPASRAIGTKLEECSIRWDWASIVSQFPKWPLVERTVRLPEVPYERADGGKGVLSLTVDAVRNESGAAEGCFLLGMDVTDRRDLEMQLFHAQKLESVGQLASGIAHEINTPIQYVGDNIEFLQVAYQELLELVTVLRRIIDEDTASEAVYELYNQAQAKIETANVDYLTEQIPKAIEQSIEGVGRVASIVLAMKEFSHPGSDEKTFVDLNQCIRSTITVSRNEWKYVAELETNLDEALPLVLCLPGEFNQVILNMIVNAAHAIADLAGPAGEKGRITVSTRLAGELAEVRVSDTGCGIPENIRTRIFDPFFTTKEVGRGTGQGLAIARHVVVDKLQGSILVESVVGQGSTFVVRMPIGA